MRKGFVFGKFLPFHNGHLALARFALQHVDFLYIIVCEGIHENIPGNVRMKWISESFKNEVHVKIILFTYNPDELPSGSEASENASELWARVFKMLVPDAGYVFTSEPYGDMLAKYMNIIHIMFNQNRAMVPVSGTVIRENPMKHFHYLPDVVKPYYCKRITLMGTESTGKTTLAYKLAQYYNFTYINEAARTLIPDSNNLTFSDLEHLITAQSNLITEGVQQFKNAVIIDTNLYTVQSYSMLFFNKYMLVNKSDIEIHTSDLLLYLENDVPYIQDGTRLTANLRNAIDKQHYKTLTDFDITYQKINGNWTKRFELAVHLIDKLLLI